MTTSELLDTTVADVLSAHPDAARVFLGFAMACAGCPFAPFETVAQVAVVYELEPRELAGELLDAVAATTSTRGEGD